VFKTQIRSLTTLELFSKWEFWGKKNPTVEAMKSDLRKVALLSH
jgi:hypothetical protein